MELDGLIASAGSDIWFHGQNVYRQSLSPDLIEHTCQILKEMDAVYLLEGFDRIYVSEKAQRILLGKEVLPNDNQMCIRDRSSTRKITQAAYGISFSTTVDSIGKNSTIQIMARAAQRSL